MSIYKGNVETADVKLSDKQIESVFLGDKEIWSNYKVPYSDKKNYSSSNHYSMSCSYPIDLLENIKVTKTIVESTTRRMSGDSYVDFSVTTGKGTKLSKSRMINDGTAIENGKLDGINYKLTATSENDLGRYTLEFTKPIKLTAITGSCGSDVGQWRETDKISISVTGLSK